MKNGRSGNVASSFRFDDNTSEVLDEKQDAIERALTRIGSEAEGYAKDLCPVSTGRLRNSVSNKVVSSEENVYIGSNVSYSITVETGAAPFKKKDKSELIEMTPEPGHVPSSNPQPFLKPAIANHIKTYRNIIEDELKGG